MDIIFSICGWMVIRMVVVVLSVFMVRNFS